MLLVREAVAATAEPAADNHLRGASVQLAARSACRSDLDIMVVRHVMRLTRSLKQPAAYRGGAVEESRRWRSGLLQHFLGRTAGLHQRPPDSLFDVPSAFRKLVGRGLHRTVNPRVGVCWRGDQPQGTQRSRKDREAIIGRMSSAVNALSTVRILSRRLHHHRRIVRGTRRPCYHDLTCRPPPPPNPQLTI